MSTFICNFHQISIPTVTVYFCRSNIGGTWKNSSNNVAKSNTAKCRCSQQRTEKPFSIDIFPIKHYSFINAIIGLFTVTHLSASSSFWLVTSPIWSPLLLLPYLHCNRSINSVFSWTLVTCLHCSLLSWRALLPYKLPTRQSGQGVPNRSYYGCCCRCLFAFRLVLIRRGTLDGHCGYYCDTLQLLLLLLLLLMLSKSQWFTTSVQFRRFRGAVKLDT